jgi:hypothetical protein
MLLTTMPVTTWRQAENSDVLPRGIGRGGVMYSPIGHA